MRTQAIFRILRLAGALAGAVGLAGACSTDTPTAPVQQPGSPVNFNDPFVVADFEALVDETGNSLLVVFTNLSTGANTFLWDFGDGVTSRGFEPQHRYAKPGVYDVTLTASNATFSDSVTEFVSVGIIDPPEAAFSIAAQEDLTVVFLNTSSDNAESFRWDFGDDKTSHEKHPTHTYAKAGTYIVELEASNDSGSDTFALAVTVPPEEDETEEGG